MAIDLSIRGGRVVLPDGVQVLDVGIDHGRIVELQEDSSNASEEVDATGLHVFPGAVDPHVHFNEPGRSEWEGFETGSAALGVGGGTCFIDMPLNSEPPLLDIEAFEAKRDAGNAASRTDFALWGGLTPDSLDALDSLADAGAVGFKAFMCDSGIGSFRRADNDTLRKGMRQAASRGLPVAVHAENDAMIGRKTDEMREAARRDWPAFVESRPVDAELIAVETALAIALDTGCKLHVVHVSHPSVIELIHHARVAKEVNVTCETCPHYLTFTSDDLSALGASAKCAPPLRDARAVSGLWSHVKAGRIDWLASDHSPCPPEMKQGDDAFAAWGGIAGIQSTLAVAMSHEPSLALTTVASLTADHAAKRFLLHRKGRIGLGFDADLTLVDTNANTKLKREHLRDRHRLSPYVGKTFQGVIKRTILRGQTIAREGVPVGQACGRFIKHGEG